MNAMSKIDLSKVSDRMKVEALCLKYPHIHSREIAKIIGKQTQYVSSVRSELKLTRIPSGENVIKHLIKENREWLIDEAHSVGVSLIDLLNAIVTDARNGD